MGYGFPPTFMGGQGGENCFYKTIPRGYPINCKKEPKKKENYYD